MKHTMKTTTAPGRQAQRQETKIDFDPTNFEGMCRIMDEYRGSKFPFFGMNENGEDVCFSVFHDRITVKTYQCNGWVRVNTYWRDGTREETFDERW